MNINRHNYEEYFLLYVDNELSADERSEVEAFVMSNPDLEEELTMLRQSKLKPDASLVMEDKSFLFKSESQPLINLQNYETFFLLYVDEELNAEERRAVETFASQHPARQQELDILMQTRLIPEANIVFPDKQLLYRHAGSERVVILKVWRIVAVAAMLLIALGIFWMNSESNKGREIAKQQDKNLKNEKNSTEKKKEADQQQSNTPEIAVIEKGISNPDKVKESTTEKKKTSNVVEQEEEHKYVAQNTNTESTEINTDVAIRPAAIARVEALQPEVKGSANLIDNTLLVDQPYEQSEANKNVVLTRGDAEPDEVAIGPIQTKNKFRGFFRQVTRVVEKTTHLPAGEHKKLLIGNIEIALK